MRRLHLLVEGQTEETVARDLLGPHLESLGWIVSVSILVTRRPAGGGAYRGGLASWGKIRRELDLLLGGGFEVVTTVLDYYGFPADSPGMGDRPTGSPYSRVAHVEQALAAEIASRRFLPNLVLHETETWVLAAASELADVLGDKSIAADLHAIVNEAGGAELVNDGVHTAPSKRLLSRCPEYRKTLDGPLAVSALGLPALRVRCPRLDSWLTTIESWS
jgi:Domain of unknown function (DUF4276)